MNKVWLKNGNIMMNEGKVILCEECPCTPCTWVLRCEGCDHGHVHGLKTFHSFIIRIRDCVLAEKSIAIDVDGSVDEGGTAELLGEKTIQVRLMNDGTADDDSYGFRIILRIFSGESPNYEVEHSFSGGAALSDYNFTDTLDCRTINLEEFE